MRTNEFSSDIKFTVVISTPSTLTHLQLSQTQAKHTRSFSGKEVVGCTEEQSCVREIRNKRRMLYLHYLYAYP